MLNYGKSKHPVIDIGLEKGIATAETRYFEVEKEKHVTREKYEKELLELTAKITR